MKIKISALVLLFLGTARGNYCNNTFNSSCNVSGVDFHFTYPAIKYTNLNIILAIDLIEHRSCISFCSQSLSSVMENKQTPSLTISLMKSQASSNF